MEEPTIIRGDWWVDVDWKIEHWRPGDRVIWKGQKYLVVGDHWHYSKRLKRWINLVKFQSKCADCAAPFEIVVPDTPKFPQPNRRCRDCVAPGIRVDSPQGRRRRARRQAA